MSGIFVTGTDTDVGKTIITGLLSRYLSEKGYSVITQKWIQTGCRGFSPDVRMHLKLMARSKSAIKDYAQLACPYLFRHPSSPHLASKLERKNINPHKIIKSFKLLTRNFDFVIVEGIGGVLVPFNQKHLLIDITKKLNLPVLVVVQNKLGAINHTLLTIEALNRRKIKILGIVFNNVRKTKEVILKDNPRIIKSKTGEPIFGVVPWQDSPLKLYEKFIPIGERICKAIGQ